MRRRWSYMCCPLQCHEDEDEDHPLAGMQPNAEGEEQEAEMVQALEDSIDVGILAEANVAKGGKSLECVPASHPMSNVMQAASCAVVGL